MLRKTECGKSWNTYVTHIIYYIFVYHSRRCRMSYPWPLKASPSTVESASYPEHLLSGLSPDLRSVRPPTSAGGGATSLPRISSASLTWPGRPSPAALSRGGPAAFGLLHTLC